MLSSQTIPMRGVEWEELDQDYWEEQDNHDIQLLGESEPFFWGNPDDSLRKVIHQHRNALQLLTRLTLWLMLSCAPGMAAAFGSSCW